MSTLRVGNITATGGTGTITVPTGNKIAQTGAVLQVIQTVKTDTFTSTATTWTDVTGLSVSITPTATTSKILVCFNVYFNMTGTQAASLRLMRDSTAIYIGDAAGSRPRASVFIRDTGNVSTSSAMYLDSPSTTSSVTYKLQMDTNGGAPAGSINRGYLDSDTAHYDARTASAITVMEIAG